MLDTAAAPSALHGGPGGPWWRQARLRRAWRASAQVGALWVLTWPGAAFLIQPGLDPSYRFSLQQAYLEGRRFGSELVFTYGPLGFLAFANLYYNRPTFLAIALRSAIMLVACTFVLWAVRRAVGNPVLAFVGAYTLLCLTFAPLLVADHVPEALGALVVAGALSALLSGRELGRRARLAVVVALGSAAALLALMKLNSGVAAGVVGAVTAASLTPWRGWRATERAVDLGAFLASGTVVFLVLWTAAGQRLSDIVAYLANSREVTSGYSSAMSLEGDDNRWEYAAAAVVVGFAFVALVRVALAVARRRGIPDRWAVLPVAVFGLAAFALFKHGFVRHSDLGHSFIFFAVLPVLVLGFLRPPAAAVAAGAIALSLVLSWSTRDTDVAASLDPRRHIEELRHQAAVLRSSAARDAIREEGRAQLAQGYALDGRSLGLLAGRRVHVDPWETAVLFAHPASTWAPPPMFQTYSAYTAALDRGNAEALAGPDGPEVVLRENLAVDGRNPAFESPQYLLAMVCNFTEAHAQWRWTVLTRTAPRCGPPALVAEVEAPAGEGVALPRRARCPGVLTVAVEGVMSGLDEQLLDLAFKSDTYMIDVAGSEYRFVPLTAGQPHVLWAPGDPPWLGGPLLPPDGGQIAVRAVPSLDVFDDVGPEQLRYRFECVPIGPPG